MACLRALILAGVLVFGLAASAQAHTALLGKSKSARATEAPRCGGKIYTVQDYRSYASRVYRRASVSKKAHRKLADMHVCQRSFRARKAVGKHHRRYVRERKARVALARLTPYRGPNGTRWAIPWYIVRCESGGSWTAYNPSGARGPYQFLGWRVPWPVRSQADKLAHHRMAARLWRGGRGASHWVCA